jgi:hypothetical protein
VHILSHYTRELGEIDPIFSCHGHVYHMNEILRTELRAYLSVGCDHCVGLLDNHVMHLLEAREFLPPYLRHLLLELSLNFYLILLCQVFHHDVDGVHSLNTSNVRCSGLLGPFWICHCSSQIGDQGAD